MEKKLPSPGNDHVSCCVDTEDGANLISREAQCERLTLPTVFLLSIYEFRSLQEAPKQPSLLETCSVSKDVA